MAYTKTTWVDRNVQYPNRYQDQSLNTYTFTPSPGTVTQAGTDITAARMNNIENGIENALVTLKRKLAIISLGGI